MRSSWLRRVGALLGSAVVCGAALMPATATADVPFMVRVNPSDRNVAKVPFSVPVTVSAGSSPRESVVTITNPQSNSQFGGLDIITHVVLVGPGGSRFGDPITNSLGVGTCAATNELDGALDCLLADYGAGDGPPGQETGISPGQSLTLTYQVEPGADPTQLLAVLVDFDYYDLSIGCRPEVSPNLRSTAMSSGHFGYAPDCTPPTHVRIKSEHIHRGSRTASFIQTAKHATGYFCQLLHGRHVMFAHTCSQRKAYTNPLPRGAYTYLVWGTNKHGRSPIPALKHFKLR